MEGLLLLIVDSALPDSEMLNYSHKVEVMI